MVSFPEYDCRADHATSGNAATIDDMSKSLQSVQSVIAATNGFCVYDPNDPFAPYYQVVAARNCPATVPSGGDSLQQIYNWVEVCLRCRFIDEICGTAICGTLGATAVAGVPGQTGQPGTSNSNPAASAGEGLGTSVADAFTGGLAGVILGPLFALLEEKTILEAQEDQVLGYVATAFNQTLPQLDAAVRAGTVSVAEASESLESVIQQLVSKIETLEVKQCDASCEFICYLKSHLDFAVNIYYPAISGQGQQANFPGAAPSPAVGAGAPLNETTAVSVGGTVAAPLASVAAGSAQTVGVSAVLSPTLILLALLIVIVGFFALKG